MNRDDLREYYRRLKEGQQSKFVNGTISKNKLISESYGDMNDPYDPDANSGLAGQSMSTPSSFGMPANRDLPGALENLAADIQDMIDNAVGQVDQDYSDDPLTKRDILDFVIRMLVEEQSII